MSDFYDWQETSDELVRTLEALGEDITFTSENITCKLSSYSASKSTNISQKEYTANGIMTFPNMISMETLKGSYFTKSNEPNKTFLLVATDAMAASDKIATVYYIECNKTIDIGYLGKQVVNYNEVETFVPISQSVKCLWEINLKEQKTTSIGTLENNTISVIIPVDYPICTKDFVRIKEFARATETSTTYTLEDKIYDVQSVSEAFINSLDGSTYCGVFIAELVEKI